MCSRACGLYLERIENGLSFIGNSTILGDIMGTGKILQLIIAAKFTCLFLQSKFDDVYTIKVLTIVPKFLMAKWMSESVKFFQRVMHFQRVNLHLYFFDQVRVN